MFHGRISLNSVLLLPLLNFVCGFWLESKYISLIVSIRSSLIHLHGFQLLVLLPKFIEISFFYWANRLNLMNIKESSDRRLVIIAKGFLKLPNLHRLIKQKSPLIPRNLALGTFGELVIVLSTKVNLLYFLYSAARTCCRLHLTKQNCLLKTFLRTLILMAQVSLYPFSLLNCTVFLYNPRWLRR